MLFCASMCYVFSASSFHVLLLGMLGIAIVKICSHFRIILVLLMTWGGYHYFVQQEHFIQQECTMLKIEIYSKTVCPYCVRAKKLLTKKGVNYTEIDIGQDMVLRDAMIKRANGRQTVPQIFINDHHVGGCDDLYALDAAGELDALLKDACNA